MDRVSVAEAARLLGVSQDAVYKRIKRGTIPWDKGTNGKTYVYIDELDESTDGSESSTDEQFDASTESSTDSLVDELRGRVKFLEDELRRKDTILMSLVQRIPELEPPRGSPSEASRGSVTPSEEEAKGEAPRGDTESSLAPEHRPWWQRWFGG
jgi:excisionase family DNA binding protein